MSVTPQTVQAEIDAGIAELKQTTQGYVKGSGGKHWRAALTHFATARADLEELTVKVLTAAFRET